MSRNLCCFVNLCIPVFLDDQCLNCILTYWNILTETGSIVLCLKSVFPPVHQTKISTLVQKLSFFKVEI